MPQPPLSDSPALFIVFNIGSGRGDADEARRAIAEGCAAAGREHRLFEVGDPAQLRPLAEQAVREAQEVGGVVVAAGGDGTINAVAQVVLAAGCAFGVLPQGTFNYFSRTHRIPSDTAEALARLLRSRPQAVQVGMVNERVFLVNASLGLYAKLLEEREAFKAQYGRSRLVAFGAAVATLMRGHRLWDLRISWHGQDRDIRTPTLFVGNNALQMQQVGMEEAEALAQGEMAAIAIKPIGRLSMLWLLVRGAIGRLGDAENVVSTSFKSIVVKPVRGNPRRLVKVAADGEVVRMAMPLHFRVAPEPLWLVKPAPGEPGSDDEAPR